MAKSIWDNRKSRPKPAKTYESNAERLLEFGAANPSPRALKAMRLDKEVRRANDAGRLPTVAEIQGRYPYTEEAAQQFIASIKRAQALAARAKAAKPAAERTPATAQANGTPAPSKAPALPPGPTQSPGLAAVLADIRRRFGDEIRTRGEQTAVKEGFIYLLTHPCFEGWVKAGMTIDYELRLATYNTSDPLSRFSFIAAKWVPDRRGAEKRLLQLLGEVSDELRSEWARVSVEEALEVFAGV